MTGRSLRQGSVALVLVAAATLLVAPLPAASASTPGLPTFYAKKVIGHSVDGRPIVAYHLGTPGARKAVLLGQMHGNEHVGVHIARAVLSGAPIKGIDLWVIPTMNPDGNAANTRQNAHGVDLNRNFPYRWTQLHGRYFSGHKSLSEPEARAMYRFLSKLRPALLVSIHQPLDGVDSTDGGARNVAFRNKLARGLRLPVRAFTCPGSDGCYGSMTSWLTATQKGSAITIEYPQHPSAALVKRSPRVILSAFGASKDSAAAHNPSMTKLGIAIDGMTVTVVGRAHDPDSRTKPLTVTATEDSQTLATGKTAKGRGYTLTFDGTPGQHTYCVTVTNAKWGTDDAKRCATVTVGPSAG